MIEVKNIIKKYKYILVIEKLRVTMKICWDNLENLRYSQRTGKWYRKTETFIYKDGYECKNPLCKQNSDKLCGHHIDYDKKNCSPGNVITVCFSCNARANFNREFWQRHYKEIINE
jgi:hypothetical protein